MRGGSVTTFLALYHGDTVNSSELLAITADRPIVEEFAARLLGQPSKSSEDPVEDPVVVSIEEGRRKALEVVRAEGA
jgi:hypothetical protein